MKPDLRYTHRYGPEFLPSWSTHKGAFINDMHASIHELTNHIEGWQSPIDSQKLFEMGYYSGDVILEIGVYGGRSAVVSLLGALSNPERKNPPQYFGIDIADKAIYRSRKTLQESGLDKYSLLVCGNLFNFASEIDIAPTMVFVDGDHSYLGAKADLGVLSDLLVEGTPVLCHDFTGPEGLSFKDFECPDPEDVKEDTMWIGVQRACHEWEEEGYAEFAGVFGGCGLFVTTDKCCGSRGGIRQSRFNRFQSALEKLYIESQTKGNR